MENQLMPNSADAEKAVLGCLLLDSSKLGKVLETICSDDFYYQQNKNLFKLLVDFSRENKPIELLSVVQEITDTGKPDDYGGISHVYTLSDNVPSSEGIVYYSKIIKDKALRRSLIQTARRIEDAAIDEAVSTADLLSSVEKDVFEIRNEDENVSGIVPMFKAVSERKKTWKRIQSGERSEYIKTGFPVIDNHYGGWPRGYVSFMGGRPAIGKTMVATSMMLRSANIGIPQGMVSIEMTKGKLVDRMISSITGVSVDLLHSGDESAAEAFADAAEFLAGHDLYVDDSSTRISAVENSIRRMSRQFKCQVVWVDYYQLIRPDRRSDKVTADLDEISDRLRLIAKQEDIALVSLLQFNQLVDQNKVNRRTGIPAARMARGSEGVYLHAGLYFGIYRQFRYHPPLRVSRKPYRPDELATMFQPIELLCLKSRERAPRDIGLWTQLSTQRIWDPNDDGFVPPDWGDEIQSRAYSKALLPNPTTSSEDTKSDSP